MSYTLEPLGAAEAARWDELIAGYESRDVFHRRAWLDYLAESRDARIALWAIRNRTGIVGYFCGGVVRKGPFRILGSPLRGWGTNSMGPVIDADVDQAGLLRAWDELALAERFAMVEVEHALLADSGLRAHAYEAVPGATYVVALSTGDPDRMWRALDSTCRNRIRKARREGLTVEDTPEPAVADEFYDQYFALMQRKGLVPPYPRETARLLVRHLRDAELLFALRVRDAAGRVIATGLFPHDDRSVYFWGGASWHDSRDLCPNDLLHWELMRLAASRGLRRYNMCGDGPFKKKFGGAFVTVKRWRKCYWRSARWAQRGYEAYLQRRIAFAGWLEGTLHPAPVEGL